MPVAGLWKGDDFPDVLFVEQKHNQPVDTGCDSSMRRWSKGERLEHVFKLFLLILFRHPNQLEESALDFNLVNPDGA